MISSRVLRHIAIAIICIFSVGCTGDDNPLADSNKGAGSIMGVVTDFATGDPVANANVSLRPGGESTLTGSDGRFEFLDVKDGDYSITVSKAEYTELIDDYVIQVRNGKRMRRDVQIKKLPTFLRITDMAGKDISTLDFGSDMSTQTKSFNIFNNGTVPVICQIIYSCSWIASVSSLPESIPSGQTVPVTVTIDRNRLPAGSATSVLTVSTNNGSAELTIIASSSSGNPPQVKIYPVNASDMTVSTAKVQGLIENTFGGKLKDCGFCYSTSPGATVNDKAVHLGAISTTTFSHTISGLEAGTTYYCRAFAITELGTGYSPEISLATQSGLATCGATTIEHYDPSTVKATSSSSQTNGNAVLQSGFCWSDYNRSPTTADNSIVAKYGDGTFYTFINPLQPNTTYYIRSFATSEYGTSYGPVLTFETLAGTASVTTVKPTQSGDEIVTGGYVTDNAGTAIYDLGICYGFKPNPTISDSVEYSYDGYQTGSFTIRFPIPSQSGTLYIRAFVTTKYGTSYGNEFSIRIY